MSRDYNDDEIIEKVEADEDEKNEYNKEDRENGPERNFVFSAADQRAKQAR